MAEEWSPWTPILQVKDARASAEFYCQALGFELDWEHQFDEGFPLYVSVSRPPLYLHLSEHHDGGIAVAELFARVPDVDAVYRRIVDRGYEPATEPTDQEHGMRDFHILDPDGHNITLGSPAGFPTEQHQSPDEQPK